MGGRLELTCIPAVSLVSVQSHYPIISTSQGQKSLDVFGFPTSSLSSTVFEVLIGCYSVSFQPPKGLEYDLHGN